MKALKIIPTVLLLAFAGLVPVVAQDKEAQEVA